ncbi:hypothetical protein MOE90_20935 [Bacillus spizizenii]|nr:hypothetical protein [Bacillus spizizenii]MCY9125023.1 hypothetical protein [Bacillus spizizenii]
MKYNMTKKDRIITLSMDDVEVSYREVIREGSGLIRRNTAIIKGYGFNRRSSNNYWKKVGRGSIKDRKEIEQALIDADSYMIEKLYVFYDNL